MFARIMMFLTVAFAALAAAAPATVEKRTANYPPYGTPYQPPVGTPIKYSSCKPVWGNGILLVGNVNVLNCVQLTNILNGNIVNILNGNNVNIVLALTSVGNLYPAPGTYYGYTGSLPSYYSGCSLKYGSNSLIEVVTGGVNCLQLAHILNSDIVSTILHVNVILDVVLGAIGSTYPAAGTTYTSPYPLPSKYNGCQLGWTTNALLAITVNALNCLELSNILNNNVISALNGNNLNIIL